MAETTYTIRLIDRVSSVATRINTSLGRVQRRAQQVSQAIDGIGLIAGGVAVAGIFKFGAELESTKLTFDTLAGSVERGNKLFMELTEFANTTPFQNDRLNKNAKTLLAFGADADSVTKTLRMLGDIAAGDQNRLDSLTLAFAQSKSAGKLMGQDLLQMINAGFNPLQIISEKTGQSIGYLKDQMSKGAISFDMVEQAFRMATEEGGRFHGLTNKMATTMAGKWSTVMGKGKFLIAELGLSMKDLFTPFIDGILKAIDFVNKYKDVLFPLLSVLVTAIGVLTALGVAFKILNAIMMVNPIILIISAIASLIAIIIVAWKRSQKFRDVLSGIWNVMKTIFDLTIGNLIPVVKRLADMFKKLFNTDDAKGFLSVIKDGILKYFKWVLSVVGSLAQAINFLFKGDFQQALEAVKSGFMGMDTTIIDAFTSGASKSKKIIEGTSGDFGENGLGGLALGMSPELQKLQAQGVVSGGIKTFNININQVTGVGTLSTSTIEESSSKIGDSVVRAITEALADVKNID